MIFYKRLDTQPRTYLSSDLIVGELGRVIDCLCQCTVELIAEAGKYSCVGEKERVSHLVAKVVLHATFKDLTVILNAIVTLDANLVEARFWA